jgi:hypothetical protein
MKTAKPERVTKVRCAPKTAPCPHCGRDGADAREGVQVVGPGQGPVGLVQEIFRIFFLRSPGWASPPCSWWCPMPSLARPGPPWPGTSPRLPARTERGERGCASDRRDVNKGTVSRKSRTVPREGKSSSSAQANRGAVAWRIMALLRRGVGGEEVGNSARDTPPRGRLGEKSGKAGRAAAAERKNEGRCGVSLPDHHRIS